jgi:hypothetical protein
MRFTILPPPRLAFPSHLPPVSRRLLQLLGLPPLLSRAQLCDDAAAAAAAQSQEEREGTDVAAAASTAAAAVRVASDALPAAESFAAGPSAAALPPTGPSAAALSPAFGDALMSEVTADDVYGAIDPPEEARMWEVTVQPAT